MQLTLSATDAKLLLSAALLLLALAVPTESVVSRIQLTKFVSGIPGIGGVGREYDTVRCEGNSTTYTCSTECHSTSFSGDQYSSCVAKWRPMCDGKWCSATVTVLVNTTSSPSSSNMRMVVDAHRIYNVTLVGSPIYRTSTPYSVTYTYKIGTSVAVGMFKFNELVSWPLIQPIRFIAAQGTEVTGVSTAMILMCDALDEATLTFDTPTVNCTTGSVEVAASTWGCPRVFDLYDQSKYVDLTDGALAATTSGPNPLGTIYQDSNEFNFGASRTLQALPTAAGRIKATFYRDRNAGEWPAGVTSLKPMYRQHPGTIEAAAEFRADPLSPAFRWYLGGGPAAYADPDNDGYGSACDCAPLDPFKNKSCSGRKMV